VKSVFEASDAAESSDVLAKIGIAGATVQREPAEAHLFATCDRLVDGLGASPGALLVMTGKAQSIQLLRARLKARDALRSGNSSAGRGDRRGSYVPAPRVLAEHPMTGLFHAHSMLRFLILLLGVANVVVLGAGLAQHKAFGKVHRVLGASFAGLLHLQVLLGVAMVAMGRYYPALVGHIVMMVLAAVAVQVSMSVNRRRNPPGLTLPLVGVIVALVCIAGGVMAIGRGLFTVTAT